MKPAADSWSVIPFLHTFPAYDANASVWIERSTQMFPVTTRLLRSIPNIKTALYSKMKPNTKVRKLIILCIFYYMLIV